MSLLVTTFGSREESKRGRAIMDDRGIAFEVLSPEPGFRLVGAPALVIGEAVRRDLSRTGAKEFLCAGWQAREEIEPSYETRERPPALEIFKRLPRTNCRACGEPSCLAFAVRVWSGEVSVNECVPVFADSGDRFELRKALEEVCAALGV